ncbi:hypothetical protein Ancab_031153 [Ancistrocladus abbreviatus]
MDGLQGLQNLAIEVLPKLLGLPDGLQSAANSLQYLIIKECIGLTALPDCLQHFTCLVKAGHRDCPNLLPLPGWFHGLTTLQKLNIDGCPHLSSRCAVQQLIKTIRSRKCFASSNHWSKDERMLRFQNEPVHKATSGRILLRVLFICRFYKTMDIALFSPSSLFAGSDGNSSHEETKAENQQNYVERSHEFPGMELLIREFSFHQLNANLLWPGTFTFVEWLVQHKSWIQGRRVIELGSGTGALAIYMRKSLQLDVTTSDYDDREIEDNIAYNCRINGVVPALPHIKHSWGDVFPESNPDWDLVIASDILLYVKQYPNLIKTISFLLKSYKKRKQQSSADAMSPHSVTGESLGLPCPAFLMSWRRRIGKEDESVFFNGCEDNGLEVRHLGSRVYCIRPTETIF